MTIVFFHWLLSRDAPTSREALFTGAFSALLQYWVDIAENHCKCWVLQERKKAVKTEAKERRKNKMPKAEKKRLVKRSRA